MKNPFDLAIYPLLLAELKPGTIIEIGSFQGGSALWLASQSRTLNLRAHIYSVDINRVTSVVDPDVTFLEGDIHQLEESPLPEILNRCARPLLVIEDGPHTFEGSLAALRFFRHYLQPGDYLVVEDGIVKSLGAKKYRNGPNRAVDQFLKESERLFEIDRRYCDFFGYNVTWNTNGYLKRLEG